MGAVMKARHGGFEAMSPALADRAVWKASVA